VAVDGTSLASLASFASLASLASLAFVASRASLVCYPCVTVVLWRFCGGVMIRMDGKGVVCFCIILNALPMLAWITFPPLLACCYF
jgi:hypothetical protein